MRFTYNQYKYNESGYRIPSKIYNNNAVAAVYQHLHHKTNFGMRMTMSTASTMTSRIQRKGFRTPSKRHPGKVLPGKLHSISRIGPGKIAPGKRINQRPHPPPCDNSNDSGLGFDQHVEVSTQQQQQHATTSQQQLQMQQSQNQQQLQTNNTELCNTINSNSSNNSSNNYHHHNYHNHHMQQQHLIRAIPSSSKKQDEKAFNDIVEENVDSLTTDLDDCITSISVSSTNSQRFEKNPTRRQIPIKRKKLKTHVDLDNDDACSEDAFVYKLQTSNKLTTQSPNAGTSDSKTNLENSGKFMTTAARNMARVAHKRQPTVIVNNAVTSQDGQVQLEIVSQPEQQHRARYQTEGSRGAVKDRSGNGFPIVRLIGYNKPAVLQVFIGTDIGRVSPHMFYQACKVAGKNSTQCSEKKVDGTMVIEIDFKPESDMTITCDCVGILKERNVDVEHRFPEHLAQKNKKKSTRCRMVFRTLLTHSNGSTETLQLCSNPIICTQPPGVPEICKKSLNSCPVDGGLELFIVGKNFLKDTHVIFQETYENSSSSSNEDSNADMSMPQQYVAAPLWEQSVLPDKEYLQQTHLICTVPPYINQNIMKPVTVLLSIISSGKKSEPHSFVYTPKGTYTTLSAATPLSNTSLHGSITTNPDSKQFMDTVVQSAMPSVISDVGGVPIWPVETKHEIDSGMMPPPITTQIPMSVRRPSMSTTTTIMLPDKQLAHFKALDAAAVLKTELMDDNSQGSLSEAPIHTQKTAVPNVDLQFHTHFSHKSSHPFEANTMPSFPITQLDSTASPNTPTQMEVDVMAAAVEMAVKNEIAKEIQQQQQHVVQVQEQAAAAVVEEILSDLSKSGASVINSGPTTTAAEAIETALTDILQQAGVASAQQNAAAAVLGRSLSISNNLTVNASSSKTNSPHSPINSLGSHLTTAQDLLLNHVEPATTLKIIPMPALLAPLKSTVANSNACPGAISATSAETKVVSETVVTAAAAAAAAAAANANGLSTDIIMNPAVSPSTVLSSSNGVATAVVSNIMSPHQVTMANSILNDIAMQVEPTQEDAAVAALALSNIMMSPTAGANGVNPTDVTSPVTAVGQADVTTATSTAVSNLIIKAAADLISNQEQQQQQQQQQQQHQQQHAVQQVQQKHQLQQRQQQRQQHSLQQHSPNATDPLVNLLLNHNDVPTHANSQNATTVDNVTATFPLSIPPVPTSPQESPLIVALATDSGLQKSVAAAAVTAKGSVVTQQTTTTTAAAASIMPTTVGVLATASVPIPPPIPQELTTMSDQDLLSYINPSTFDQI